MRLKTILFTAVLFLALSTAATPMGLSASHEDVVEVRLVETGDDAEPYAFDDDEITIEAGTTVRWVHTHGVFHTVTSTDSQDERQPNGLFDETLSSEDDAFEFTFEEPGTFHYYCKPHSGFMFGTVHVEGEAGDEQANDVPLPGALIPLALAAAVGLRIRD